MEGGKSRGIVSRQNIEGPGLMPIHMHVIAKFRDAS